MQNSITTAGNAAESSTNAELNSSAPITPNLMLAAAFRQRRMDTRFFNK